MRPFGFDGSGETVSAGAGADGAPGGTTQSDPAQLLAEIFFPEIGEWQPVLSRLSVALPTAIEVAMRARAEALDFQSALLAWGGVGRSDLLLAVAGELGLGVVDKVDPERLVIQREQAVMLLRGRNGQVPVKFIGKDDGVIFLITSERLPFRAIRERLAARPALAARMRLVDRQVLRAALLRRARPLLVRRATLGLFEKSPLLSAFFVLNSWQALMVGAFLVLLPVGLLLAHDGVLTAAHILATLFFFACVSLRFSAVACMRPSRQPARVEMPDGEKPVYSVLVALYQEAAIVPNLVATLERLVWPRDRLDIKLVCEAGDSGTLAVISALDLPAHMEVVVVPKGGPRTKPKALAYALQMAAGELVVLYDAEDDPHPMQLIEAWQRFRQSGPELAAVQAPLEISNRRDSMIARMFAFEYAGLFRGILPWLSDRQFVLPLGGTSNHFRRATLEAAGGWDPFNVTEDADLGMRLARLGYRTEVIFSATREAAPKNLHVWLPQRTRWFKGWAQTFLVHMRRPAVFARELGFPSFLIAQVLLAGTLASALLHPLLLATFVFFSVELAFAPPLGTLGRILLIFDTVNIVCGYTSFLLLGWQTLTRRERRGFWKIVAFTPLYWVMLSIAGWRALWYLWRRPHHWEKTPHEPLRTASAGSPR